MRFDKANMSVVVPNEDAADEVMDATADDLQRFIRAGGAIDFPTWSGLNEFSKDCLIAAKYEKDIEFVYMIGKVIGENGPEMVWSLIDDGEMLKDKVATNIADDAAIRAAESLRSEPISDSTADPVPAKPSKLAGDK